MKTYQLVGFERQGHLFLGAWLGQKNGKAEIITESGEKILLALKKQHWHFDYPVNGDNPKELKESLATIKNAIMTSPIDLASLWELYESEPPDDLAGLSSTYYDQCETVERLRMFLTLAQDRIYFRYKNGSFQAHSRAKVNLLLQQQQAQEQRAQANKEFLSWFEQCSQTPTAIPTAFQEAIEGLKKLALYGHTHDPNTKRLAAALSCDPDKLLVLLENKGFLPVDVNELPYRAGVVFSSSTRVQDSIAKLPASPPAWQERSQWSTEWIVAIDDQDTLEVDDALSCEITPEHITVGVHIADVAATISPETHLDRFAAKRLVSTYFPEKTLTMFPMELVRSHLTLTTTQARPTLSGFFTFDPAGTLLEYRFELLLVQLQRRITYEQTRSALQHDTQLQALQRIAQKLQKQRCAQGAVVTSLPYLKIDIRDGELTVKRYFSDTPGQLVVSEFMILFNHLLAQEFIRHEIPALFRTQPTPVTAPDITPDDPLYLLKFKWGLPPSVLSCQAAPHHTLGIASYVQATSPIRRYPDLLLHRQARAMLQGTTCPYDQDFFKALLSCFEKAEKKSRAMEAERRLYWLIKYLQAQTNACIPAVVSRVSENQRLHVFLPDYLHEFPVRHNETSGTYEIGACVHVQVTKGCPRRRKLELQLVPSAT